jgi:hypothetical protein
VDQAESNLYYKRVARAHEIVDRRQREWELESKSELSILASSQFNGMDSIESSQGIGVKLSNLEMGGIGSRLTCWGDQDDQDDQDGSIDDVSGRVIAIQGARTSLRRTRSGKVVKYKD